MGTLFVVKSFYLVKLTQRLLFLGLTAAYGGSVDAAGIGRNRRKSGPDEGATDLLFDPCRLVRQVKPFVA